MDFRFLIFIVIVIVMAIIPSLWARKNEDSHPKKQKHSSCGNWTFGPCVLKDKASTCGAGKRAVIPANEDCPKKQKQVHCRIPCEAETPASDCKYKKLKGVKGKDTVSCDPVTNQREVTLTLVKGDPSVCAPTKVISKECHKRQVRAVEAKKRRKTGERKQKQTAAAAAVTEATTVSTVAPKEDAECKYQKSKSAKAACDPVTNTRTVVKQLKKNAPASCEPTKTITESCHAKKSKPKKGGRKNSGHKNAEHKGEGD